MEQIDIYTVIMRGGTSKALFLKNEDLPADQDERNRVILRMYGSPDSRQIDGLGGAEPLTSKLAIIGPSTKKDADIDYTFGQVSIDQPFVDYSGNCGNISSAVGPYAIDEGYVDAVEPITTVRIHNTNTGKVLVAEVPVKDGKAAVKGDYVIDGVPGTGAKITLDFSDTAGSRTGSLLPTGREVDFINTREFGKLEVSMVDAANPMVFVRASDLGLTGRERPEEVNDNEKIQQTLEEIRGKAAEVMGMVNSWKDARKDNPAFPMIAFIASAGKDEEVDFHSRLMFMQVMHKTYAGTGTICTGAAARIRGSLVNQALLEGVNGESGLLKIGHPLGYIDIEVSATYENDKPVLQKAAIYRTARRLMEGKSFIPSY